MPRTTLDIDKTVLEQLKKRQEQERKSLGQLASELLALALSSDPASQTQPPFEWKTASMDAIVDIADKDALYSALDDQ